MRSDLLGDNFDDAVDPVEKLAQKPPAPPQWMVDMVGYACQSSQQAMSDGTALHFGDAEPFVCTDLQLAILEALDEKAMKVQELADAVAGGVTSRLYKPGGLTELRDAGLVKKKPGVGYYRPDALPEKHVPYRRKK